MARRILLVSLAVLLGLAVAGVGLLLWAAKRAEPSYAGEIALAGLAAPVVVTYGPRAVPTIEADSLGDLLFAQGFVVASERMWQMDLLRRLAYGRLSEIFGEETLAIDRMFRTFGLGRAAKENFEALDARDRNLLTSYAAGVNAYRAQAAGRLPLEYLIARSEPEPWTGVDSLAIGEYMSRMLSFNAREELVFLRMAARVGRERAQELFPTDEGIAAPAPPPELSAIAPDWIERYDALLAEPARFGLPIPGPASNAWAVNGKRSEDGMAILANDTHLPVSVPSVWYQLELMAPDLHVVGLALPGVPLVTIGHNQDLAWGFTASMADTQDIFVERPTEDGGSVLRPSGTPEAIRSRGEEILVRGRLEPVSIEIRSTSLGVIVDDILGAPTGTDVDLPPIDRGFLLALRTNLELPESSIGSFFRLNTAASLDQGRAAILDLKHSSQNLMLAHRDGGIAWQVSGAIPLRDKGTGIFPSPGWVPGYGWRDYSPPSLNPGITNPPGYALLTANNRTVPLDYPVQLTRSWMAPYRAERIKDILNERRIPLNAQAMERMQLDRISVQATRYIDSLRRVAPELLALDPEARRIADEYLTVWDGGFAADSRAAALFALLQPALYEALFGDELGDDLPLLMSIAVLSYSALDEALHSGRSSFWDDVRTEEQEGPAHVWARALRSAKVQLDARMPELGKQRLDRLRTLYFPHAFDSIPVLGRLFAVGPIPIGGDAHTLNNTKTYPTDPGKVLFVPTMRVVYTPSDWSQTRGVLDLGQSGHLFSRYRADQLDDWLDGRSHPWPWHGPEPSQAIGTLVLRPDGN